MDEGGFEEAQEYPSEIQYVRSQVTPSQAAAIRLFRILENYSEITADLRRSLYDEMLDLPNIRFMNMETLAVALVLLYRSGGNMNPTFFRENVDSLLGRLGEAPQGVDRETYRQGHRESVLRYVFNILAFRGQ